MGNMSLLEELQGRLPHDPESLQLLASQLNALALTHQAAASKRANEDLQDDLRDHERRIDVLEAENDSLRTELERSEEALTVLTGEKAALIDSVMSLHREVQKLEAFKRTLLQSLQDNDHEGKSPPPVSRDDGSSLVSSILAGAASQQPRIASSDTAMSYSNTREMRTPTGGVSRPHSHGSIHTPENSNQTNLPPRETGNSQRYDSSSANKSSAQSYPHRVDGKDFFKQARSRLQYEQFADFLQNIKELNAGKQTREDTLARARDVFGKENHDLYESFQALLSRHLPAS